MDISSRQKMNKETQTLNHTVDQIDLIAMYKTFHLKEAEYSFFSRIHSPGEITSWVTRMPLLPLLFT